MKLTILSRKEAYDCDFRLFFGRIEECYELLLKFDLHLVVHLNPSWLVGGRNRMVHVAKTKAAIKLV